MTKIVARLNGFIHNYPIYTIIVLTTTLFCLIGNYANFINKIPALLIILFVSIYYLLVLIVNSYRSRKYKYLRCSYFLFSKNFVCINQRIKSKPSKDKCPRMEFARELKEVLEQIPEGTICHCCTHDTIKNGILKRYPDAYCKESYKKDLLKLKKLLKTNKCDTCTYKTDCPLFKEQDETFYAIHFRK